MNNSVQATGKLTIFVYDGEGNLLATRQSNNMVVATGRNFFLRRIAGLTVDILREIHFGEGTTAVADEDTVLETELFTDQFAIATPDADTMTVEYYLATSASGVNDHDLTEAGLFTENDVLVARTVFSPITKTSSNAMLFRWAITLEAV